jgi:hypothetical protein
MAEFELALTQERVQSHTFSLVHPLSGFLLGTGAGSVSGCLVGTGSGSGLPDGVNGSVSGLPEGVGAGSFRILRDIFLV